MSRAVCAAFSGLRVSPQAPAAAARGLASRASAFVAAPKPVTALRLARPCQSAAAVPVECADGRKGGKLKTRKSAAKRFKITGSGKVMVRRSGKQHLNEKLLKAKKKALSKERQVSVSDLENIKGCLPYANIK